MRAFFCTHLCILLLIPSCLVLYEWRRGREVERVCSAILLPINSTVERVIPRAHTCYVCNDASPGECDEMSAYECYDLTAVYSFSLREAKTAYRDLVLMARHLGESDFASGRAHIRHGAILSAWVNTCPFWPVDDDVIQLCASLSSSVLPVLLLTREECSSADLWPLSVPPRYVALLALLMELAFTAITLRRAEMRFEARHPDSKSPKVGVRASTWDTSPPPYAPFTV